MQIIIDIPETIWVAIQNGEYCGILDDRTYNAIKNGTILPKGHGRLIDADALEVSMGNDWKTGNEITNCIKSAPTIIEQIRELEQPDKCKFVKDADCCYPIEDCINCPNHKESD